MKVHHRLIILAFMALISLPACAQEPRTAGEQPRLDTRLDNSETYRQLNLFGDVFERVREQYVDPVEDEELIETAINGMLSSLDPHSSYLDEDSFKEMQVQTEGKFGGLGIEVTMENGFVKVVSPIDDTPAYRAGVQAGDFITHIDGEPVIGMTLNEAVDKMRGTVGDPIEITVRREGEEEALKFNIVRDIIRIRSVRSKIFDDSIGYIRITTFNQNTYDGLKEAIEDIRGRLGQKVIGYIIDLRNNPGGLLDQAIAVSDAFIDKGEIVSTRGRSERDTKRDNATSGDLAEGLPLVVLINGGSASGSEIVAGALQDHRRALLVGTKSFGKGSVQTVIPLMGHGAMRLTTARYYTPSGRSIQAEGIEPDIKVELAKIEQVDDKRMRESDLRDALDNGMQEDGEKQELVPEDEAENMPKPEDEMAEKSENLQDYQLLRAIDLLRGISLYGDRLDNVKIPLAVADQMETGGTAPVEGVTSEEIQ
jgi:carboxyl-terminal processing protease